MSARSQQIAPCSKGYSNVDLAKASVIEYFELEGLDSCTDLELRDHELATDHFRKECLIWGNDWEVSIYKNNSTDGACTMPNQDLFFTTVTGGMFYFSADLDPNL